MKSTEIFKPIPSLNGKYEVSAGGQIRNAKTKRILKPWIHNCGYQDTKVSLDGKVIHVRPHKAVAEVFLGKRPEGYMIDHINRNKLDNRAENLRYVTVTVSNFNRDNVLDVTLYYKGKTFHFNTQTQAAHFLSKHTGLSVSSAQNYFSERKTYIRGWLIGYGVDKY